MVGSGESPAAGTGSVIWSMMCCCFRARLPSLTNVLLLACGIDDLGLLLVLPGLTIRMALEYPFELRDGLLATCEAASCIDQSSNAASEGA